MGEYRHLLVVEPDPDRRRRLREAFGESPGPSSGWTVVAIDAVDAAPDHLPVDAVLAGDLDPESVARLCEVVADRIPVVSHPSSVDGRLASELLGAGAADYVHGDASRETVVERVERAAADPEEADAVLDRVFETSPVGLFVYDTDLNVVRMNDRAEKLLRADRERFDERMQDGETMRDLRDENGAPIAREDLPSAVVARTGEPMFGEVIAAHESDSVQWIRLNAAPVLRDGELTRVVVAVDDITEERRRTDELKRQNRRLEQFGDVVSHDLRNPLSVATGYLGLARDTDDETAREDALDRVADAHVRMVELVSNLRTLARSGESLGETEPVDVGELARRAWRTVDTGDLELDVLAATTDGDGDEDGSAGEEASTFVVADPERLRQLFENLFRNASEHAAGATTVTVTLSPGQFAVADDGAGFPGESPVFDGKRGVGESASKNGDDGSNGDDGGNDDDGADDDDNGADDDGGSGLGLVIVADIADAHGWDVTAENGPDGGAKFTFTGVETASVDGE